MHCWYHISYFSLMGKKKTSNCLPVHYERLLKWVHFKNVCMRAHVGLCASKYMMKAFLALVCEFVTQEGKGNVLFPHDARL